MLNNKPKSKIRLTNFGKWLIFLVCFLLFSAQNTGNNLLYLVCSCVLTALIFAFIDILISMHGFKAELLYPKIANPYQNIDIICKIFKINYSNRYYVRFENSWFECIKRGNDCFLKKTLLLDKIGKYTFKGFSVIKPSMLDVFYFQYVFPDFVIFSTDEYGYGFDRHIESKYELEQSSSYDRSGEFYAQEVYHQGLDASYINWSVSARSNEDWVIIREKDSEVEKEKHKYKNADKDELTSNDIPENNFTVYGKTYREIFRESLKKELNTYIFRLMIALALLACFGIYNTGFLQNIIYFTSVVFLILGIKEKGIAHRYHKYIYWSCLLVGTYILVKILNPNSGAKIVSLLEFSILILTLQYITMINIRSIFGALTLIFMILLGIAAMNINSAFPAVLLPFLILASMVFAFLRINLVSTESEVKNKFAVYPKGIMGTILLLIIFTFLWIPFFYLIPRTTSYGIASNLAEERSTKGFSDNTMNLNDNSFLEDNLTVVMRIIPNEEKTISHAFLRRLGKKLIKGSTFSEYENGEWKKIKRFPFVRDLRNSSGELILDRNFTDFKKLHTFDIVLEDSDMRNVLVPSQTKKISFQNHFIGIEMDGTLFFVDRRSIYNKRYMVSLLLDPEEYTDSTADELTDIESDYRLVPYISLNGISDRIMTLASSLMSGNHSISERVNKAINYLQKSCKYTLEPSELSPGEDPVENFIFVSKSGNCQHFSTALCFLLRGMGIPCRVVTGYMMGEWNDVGSFFTVRQSHAHAWVEVFYPKSGWIPFDPTPADTSSEASFIKHYWDKLIEIYEGYWFNYVYSFDMKAQNLVKKNLLSKEIKKIGSYITSPSFGGYLTCILLLAYLLRNVIKSIYKYSIKTSRWIPFVYILWENKLKTSRLAYETPSEYHDRLLSLKSIDIKTRENLKHVEDLIDEYAFKKGVNKIVITIKIWHLLNNC